MPTSLRPDSDVSDGGWTTDLGGTSLYEAIDETSPGDGDYIRSSESPAAGDVAEVALPAATDPLSSVDHVVRYRYGKDAADGDAIDLIVRLVQGTTVIASWLHEDIAVGFTLAEQTLTAPEADAISDYGDLRVRFEAMLPSLLPESLLGPESELDPEGGLV